MNWTSNKLRILLLLFIYVIETNAQLVSSDVCGTDIGDQSGSISSPNYPDNYPDSIDCTWTFLAPENTVISVSFANFLLESGLGCTYDFLGIIDGENSLGNYCGFTGPNDFTSTTNNVTFVFHTDGSSSEDGFLITWRFKEATAETTDLGIPLTAQSTVFTESIITTTKMDQMTTNINKNMLTNKTVQNIKTTTIEVTTQHRYSATQNPQTTTMLTQTTHAIVNQRRTTLFQTQTKSSTHGSTTTNLTNTKLSTLTITNNTTVTVNNPNCTLNSTVDFSVLLRRKRSNAVLFISLFNLTETVRDEFVTQHNGFREIVGSSNMRKITWDDDIAAFAASYVRNCSFEHSDTDLRRTDEFAELGENLHLKRVPSSELNQNPIDSINPWFAEFEYFTYDDQTCAVNKQCGHYTQFVWAETYKIGCAAAYCNVPPADQEYFHHTLLTCCNYAVAGNVIDPTTNRVERPFSKGDACSQCSDPTDVCENDLCANSARDQVATGTSSTTAMPSTTPTTTTTLITRMPFTRPTTTPIVSTTTTNPTASTTSTTIPTSTTSRTTPGQQGPDGTQGDASHCIQSPILFWVFTAFVFHFIFI